METTQELDAAAMSAEQLQALSKAQLIEHLEHLQKLLQEKQAVQNAVENPTSQAAHQQAGSGQASTSKPEKYNLWPGLSVPVRPEDKQRLAKIEKRYSHVEEEVEDEDEDGGEEQEQEEEMEEDDNEDEFWDDEGNYKPGQQLAEKWQAADAAKSHMVMGPDWFEHVHFTSCSMKWDFVQQRFTYNGEGASLQQTISPAMFLYRLICLFPGLDLRAAGHVSPRGTWMTVLQHIETGAFVQCGEEEAIVTIVSMFPPMLQLTNEEKRKVLADLLELATIVCRPDLRHPWKRDSVIAGSINPCA